MSGLSPLCAQYRTLISVAGNASPPRVHDRPVGWLIAQISEDRDQYEKHVKKVFGTQIEMDV
jgi:hypothetical protein